MARSLARRGGVWALALVAAGCGTWTGSARAQCPASYLPTGPIVGNEGNARVFLEWDPDGTGPSPTVLVAGGSFLRSGAGPAENIAAFDGQAWSPIGAGLTNGQGYFGIIEALTVYQGKLIASGFFDRSGTTPLGSVARWSGTQWEPMGSELNGRASQFAIYNNDLYAVGGFASGGDVPIAGVARWNGSAWVQVGGPGASSRVSAAAVFGGSLWIGGEFGEINGIPMPRLAKWNGSTWTPGVSALASNAGATFITGLHVWNGELFAAGEFDVINGVAAQDVARFNGTQWQACGGGVEGTISDFVGLGGVLYASGQIIAADGQPVNNLATWNGTSWSAVPTVTDQPPFGLGTFRGELVAGNVFDPQGGGLGIFNGTSWRNVGLGFNADVVEMVTFNGGVAAVGAFTQTPNGPASGIAFWNGTTWSPLGGLLNDGGVGGIGVAAIVFNGDLIVGGRFTSAGGVPANRIARYNAATDTWSPLGVGFDGSVTSLAIHQGELYAAGLFDSSGGVSTSKVARWDGSAWQPLGFGISSSDPDNPAFVRALASFGGRLFVGGGFDRAGDAPAFSFASWDGSSWSTEGNILGVFPIVEDLQVFGGELIVGGTFDAVGPPGFSFESVPSTGGIARWTGTELRPMDRGAGGVGALGWVFDLYVHQGVLYSGGLLEVTSLTPSVMRGVTRWDGNAWQPLGTFSGGTVSYGIGEFASVRTLSSFGNELVFGGAFTTAGGNNAGNWGRYVPAVNPPTVALTILEQTANVGETVTITATPSVGNVAYEWRRSGFPIPEGQWSSFGGTYVGTTGQIIAPGPVTLTINNANLYDSGIFALAILTPCQDAVSPGQLVTIVNPCVADFDNGSGWGITDGGVGIEDLLFYLALFEAGEVRADVDDGSGTGVRDDGVGIEDLLYFLQRFENGC